MAWHENRGAGTFGPEQVISLRAAHASAVHATDLDGDGDSDVLATLFHDERVVWFENRGGVFDAARVVSSTVLQSMTVATADLDGDGDGDSDVLSASTLDDTVVWFDNPGGGYDPDADGLSTGAESCLTGTDPHVTDTDGGGVDDGTEANGLADPLHPADG